MTPDDLTHLEAIEQAMTAGPWVNDETGTHVYLQYALRQDTEKYGRIGDTIYASDGEGIAAMRNAFPGLLAEVRKLTGQRDIFLKALHGVIADLETYELIEAESTTAMNVITSFYLASELDGTPLPPHVRAEVESSEFWSPKEQEPQP